jgi:hypothetical protein
MPYAPEGATGNMTLLEFTITEVHMNTSCDVYSRLTVSLTLQSPVVIIPTTRFNIETSAFSPHIICLCVSCGSHSEHQLFP